MLQEWSQITPLFPSADGPTPLSQRAARAADSTTQTASPPFRRHRQRPPPSGVVPDHPAVPGPFVAQVRQSCRRCSQTELPGPACCCSSHRLHHTDSVPPHLKPAPLLPLSLPPLPAQRPKPAQNGRSNTHAVPRRPRPPSGRSAAAGRGLPRRTSPPRNRCTRRSRPGKRSATGSEELLLPSHIFKSIWQLSRVVKLTKLPPTLTSIANSRSQDLGFALWQGQI